MRLVSLSGFESVVHPVHGEAKAGSDGVFDLPDTFGVALLADPAHWREEADHLATLARQELESLTEPGRAAQVLSELRDEVESLKAKVAELEDAATKPATTTPTPPATTATAPSAPTGPAAADKAGDSKAPTKS